MSDFEDDEMDIDKPSTSGIEFSSGNASKGKRSAANLPVEAEDTLPWYEFPTHRASHFSHFFQGRKVPP